VVNGDIWFHYQHFKLANQLFTCSVGRTAKQARRRVIIYIPVGL